MHRPVQFPLSVKGNGKKWQEWSQALSRITAWAWCCSRNEKARTGGSPPDAVPGKAHCVWPCTKLPWWLPVPSKRFTFPEEIFRNSICQEVGWVWARLCLACVSWYVGREMYCIQFLLRNVLGQTGWRAFLMAGNPRCGAEPGKTFLLQRKMPSLGRPCFYFSMAFLTDMWALPLWWEMQPLMRTSVKAIRIFSWILPQRKKNVM